MIHFLYLYNIKDIYNKFYNTINILPATPQIIFDNTNNYFRVEANNAVLITGSGITISPYQWYHIAFVRSGSTGYVYVNGVLVDTNTSATASYTAENTFIGAHYNGSNVSFWNGYIPQVYIYLSEQSGTDVSNLFNNTKSTYGL